MNRLLVAAVFAGALIAAPARGDVARPTPSPIPTATPLTTVELGGSSQQLTNGRGTWQNRYVATAFTSSTHHMSYFSYNYDQRFQSSDSTYTAGVYLPASAATTLNLEVGFSPTHQNLPQLHVLVSLEHRLRHGWGYILGVQQRSYTGADVQTDFVTIDRYWKSFRAAYSISASRLSTMPGVSAEQSALLTHYYGADQESSVTIAANAGREVDDLENGVHVSAVAGETLTGMHWSGPRYGFTWTLSTLRQGTLYTRSGVQLGVRTRF